MFNSHQRYLTQRSTTTTDNTPSVVVPVSLDLKDTYITNKESDYASSVYEPKGSKFVSVSDVDFQPVEPGTYVLPLSDEDTASLIQDYRKEGKHADDAIINTTIKPSSSKRVTINQTKNHYIEGFSFGEGGFVQSLKKGFENSKNTDGYIVISATKNDVPYLLTLTKEGEIVPFARLQSTLPPEVIPGTPENVGLGELILDRGRADELLNTGCCCDNNDDTCNPEGWNSTEFPPPEVLSSDGKGVWSETNPCGYLGTTKSCRCSKTMLIIVGSTTLYDGYTGDNTFETWGWGDDPNLSAYRPVPPNYTACAESYDPNEEEGYRYKGTKSSTVIGACIESNTRSYCYTLSEVDPLGLLPNSIRSMKYCVYIQTFCRKIIAHTFAVNCGCPDCPCSLERCEGDPNCQSDEPLETSPNPNPIVLPDEI